MSTPEPLTPPSAPPAPAGSIWSKAWHGFLAAITSPTAVAKEKSFAVFVAVRVLQAVGASAALIGLLEKLSS